jgi:hypothetical protein
MSADSNDKNAFIKNFYFSKLSLKDQDLAKEFKKSLNIDEKELKYPLWL